MNFTFESSSQVQSKTRRLVKFLLELIVKPLEAAFEIFNSVELTFEFRLHSKSHRLNCGHRARNKIKLKRTCILTRFMFLTEQKNYVRLVEQKLGQFWLKSTTLRFFLRWDNQYIPIKKLHFRSRSNKMSHYLSYDSCLVFIKEHKFEMINKILTSSW